jgi:eukaryotic-like serine/threonine-protein kinase
MNPQRWQQIESLYHVARDLKPGERETFLVKACAGDDALRTEVESLLRQDSRELEVGPAGTATWTLAQNPASSLEGREIGSYQIISILGVGGMGEVYRAKDLKLRRDVAIKVLPVSVANDADQLARLKREAQMLATLNHPNIAAIYGLDQSSGTTALVLELVEGPTLAERLASRPLPTVEALKFALQIARALEAAHDKGIIHRDLKPANIKITPDGTVKVLDFGLAKAFAVEGKAHDQTELAATFHTREGVIAGTPAYMSPEQALGKTVDRRTDIWAFGCLFYEMLTGKSPFAAETMNDTISRVLSAEPHWQSIPGALPERGMELLQRCLEKDLNRRRRDIGDVRVEIEEILRGLESKTNFVKTVTAAPKPKSSGAVWAAIGLAAAALVGAAIWYVRPEAPVQVMRLNMDVKPADALSGLG